MFRFYSFVYVLAIGLVFHGCSAFEYLDGSSRDEIKTFNMSKSEMADELSRVKGENEKLQKQIDGTKEDNQRIRVESQKKVAHLSEQNRSLNQENQRLNEGNRRITDENETLKKRLADIQVKTKTSAPAPHKAGKDVERLKIKVLSGDGNLSSAKRMVKRLRTSGYKVHTIDLSHRSDFKKTTIYFAPNFKYQATRIMSDLGGSPILKPLTWPSKFNLIIVTESTK